MKSEVISYLNHAMCDVTVSYPSHAKIDVVMDSYRPTQCSMSFIACVAGGIRDRVRVLCLPRMAERGNRGAARELERAASAAPA